MNLFVIYSGHYNQSGKLLFLSDDQIEAVLEPFQCLIAALDL